MIYPPPHQTVFCGTQFEKHCESDNDAGDKWYEHRQRSTYFNRILTYLICLFIYLTMLSVVQNHTVECQSD